MEILYTLKNKATKEAKQAHGSDFWETHWENDDYITEEGYINRLNTITSAVNSSIESEPSITSRRYIEVNLDEKAASKTSKPHRLWDMNNIRIVSSSTDNKIIISAELPSLTTLKKSLEEASYIKAKEKLDDVRTIDRNAFREVYAFTGASVYSRKITERIDTHLFQKLSQIPNQKIECIIEMASYIPFEQYDVLFNAIAQKLDSDDLQKVDAKFFINNQMYFLASITKSQVEAMLSDAKLDDIAYIYPLGAMTASRSLPSIDINSISITPPQTDEIIGLIDSGINSKAISSSVFHTEKYIPSHKLEDTSHGTFVASRILYGGNITSLLTSSTLTPIAQILNLQVLYQGADGAPEIEDLFSLADVIEKSLGKYPKVKIYNLSINNKLPIESRKIHPITVLIDYYSRKYDVLFIGSSGNHDSYLGYSTYDEIISSNGIEIASPSDAINMLTVGSVAEITDDTTWSPVNGAPSPFSRGGHNRDYIIKPELVAHGGEICMDNNLEQSKRNYGVEGIVGDKIEKDNGTSFSTPLVTREAIFALDYLHNSDINEHLELTNNYANTIKAMLIHSAEMPIQQPTGNMQKFLGMGTPNIAKLLSSNSSNVNILYADTIKGSFKKHRVLVDIPNELIDKKLQITFTCVYNPPVNNAYVDSYNRHSLEANVRLIKVLPSGEEKISYLSKLKGRKKVNGKKFSLIHSETFRNKFPAGKIEVITQLTTEDDDTTIEQNYCWILSVSDPSENIDVQSILENSAQLEQIIRQEVEVSL
ncbi:MAG: S8 family peptidase [Candidatus Dojkabacteria bacterium]|nr:MAG: S8 family peptidase [Candidatus Dojkabacteria bacterium]